MQHILETIAANPSRALGGLALAIIVVATYIETLGW